MSESLHVVCPRCDGVNRVPAARLSQRPKCGKCGAPLFKGAPLNLDGESFSRQVGRSDLPVLVDFWAPWCGPCRMMAPVLEQAARDLEPQVRVVKVNTEQDQAAAAKYGIRSIPTLVLFKRGREAARVSGAMDARRLQGWLEQHL
jgi:thioredoxin 2